MKKFKNVIAILLSVCMIAGVSACGNEKDTTEVKKDLREPAKAEKAEEKFVDKDGEFEFKTVDWQGPDGYVVIYPDGDNDAKKLAQKLSDYYKNMEITLSIKSDKTKETEKEILVGKTNRSYSDKKIDASKLSVAVKDDRLIFNGGHTVTLKSAVEKFIRTAPQKGKANVFELTTDFKASVLDGYEYVWGDEFEGNGLDMTKWDFEQRMSGSTQVEISYEKDVIDVGDGRLKLHALNKFNPLREGTKYKVPYSVVTKYKMNYVYGYAEIRARVPFFKGAWPSFWSQVVGTMGGRNAGGGVAYDPARIEKAMYGVEVDIFEVFGNFSQVVPNAHKAYIARKYDYDTIHGVDKGNHTVVTPVKIWDWAEKGADLDKLPYEYHLYGFEWNEKEMSFYVDGEKYFTMDIVNSWDLCEDMSQFHEPLFIMFNNHVFADDFSWYENVVEEHDKMPFCYYIDWFRLYQKPNTGELHIDETPKNYVGR